MKESIDRLMTLEEVAWYLRLSNMTVYRMIKRGEILAKKIGNQWRFSEKNIDKLIEKDKFKDYKLSNNYDESINRRQVFLYTYRPFFKQYFSGILETKPDIISLLDRRGARLIKELELLPDTYKGKICYAQSFDFVSKEELKNNYIAFIDDSVQHGVYSNYIKKQLKSETDDVVTQTFALLTPKTFISDNKKLIDKEVNACLKLSDFEFTKFTGEITNFLLQQGKTQDTDHIPLNILIGGDNKFLFEEFLYFLFELGNVFIIPSPAEENGIVTITLDEPNFFNLDNLELPFEVDFKNGVKKIRFYYNLKTNECSIISIVMPKVILNINDYFSFKERESIFPINLIKMGLDYEGLSEKNKASSCYRDFLLNISILLLKNLIAKFIGYRNKLSIKLTDSPFDEEEINYCFGKKIGEKLSKTLLAYFEKVLSYKTEKEDLTFFNQESLFDNEGRDKFLRYLKSTLASRELIAIRKIMPLLNLLIKRYDELKKQGINIEDRVTRRGVSFEELVQVLKGKLQKNLVSFGLDFGVDRTLISPVCHTEKVKGSYWKMKRIYRPGENSPGKPPNEIGHGDSKALDPKIRTFRRDRFIVPFILSKLRYYCPTQKEGVEAYLLNKVIACLNIDWFNGNFNNEFSYWEAPPGEFGPLVQVSSASGFIESGMNIYQLSRDPGSYFKCVSKKRISKDKREYIKNYYIDNISKDNLRKILRQYFNVDELVNIDCYIRFYSAIFNKLDANQPSVDLLLTLSACYSNEKTYIYGFKNLALWVVRFNSLIENLREKVISQKGDIDLFELINSCERTSINAIDKISRYENLDNTKSDLGRIFQGFDDIVLGELSEKILNRMDKKIIITPKLSYLKKIAELMKAISTLTKYLLSKIGGFGISLGDKEGKYNDFKEIVSKKAAGLLRKDTIKFLDLEEDNLNESSINSIINILDVLFQEICLVFHQHCPEPDIPDETDGFTLISYINATEKYFNKKTVKEAIFMFIDLDKSTPYFSDKSPSEIAKIIKRYDDLTENIIEQNGGEIQNKEGDGSFVIFNNSKSACISAIIILKKIKDYMEDSKLPGFPVHPLPMGIGITKGDYFELGKSRNKLGSQINWASKLASLDPASIYVTEDIIEDIKIEDVNINSEEFIGFSQISELKQKLFKINWNTINLEKLL